MSRWSEALVVFSLGAALAVYILMHRSLAEATLKTLRHWLGW
jgi:hypothetical protein